MGSSDSLRTIAVVTDEAFAGDRLFADVSRDGVLEPYRLLRRRLAERGQLLRTADLFERSGETPDVVVCLDVPIEPLATKLPRHWLKRPRWAILTEPEVTWPRNWDVIAQAQFSRLFTWRGDLVDNERFFKLNYPNPIDGSPIELHPQDRLCTLIAGNKHSSHPAELYSQRREVIRWFERHHPEEFDLYGVGWDLLVVGGPRVLRSLNVVLPTSVRRTLAPRFRSYRGTVESKADILSRYRFTLCFENARGIEGYITEKLFDCLLAGTIPVYWGAPDIAAHVPTDCFIDYRDFDSFEALYAHLRSLSEADRRVIREAGRRFLEGKSARAFSTATWVETLLHHLEKE